MLTTKTVIVGNSWVQVPVKLVRQAGRWVEVFFPFDEPSSSVKQLQVLCFAPDDRSAVKITAPWAS